MPLPAKLANAPALSEWLEWYFLAFLDLCSCRSGMGDGPIMWTAMDTYAQRHEITDPDDYMFFKELLSAMDMAYIDFQKKQSEAKKTALGNKKAPVQPQQPQPVRTRSRKHGRP